MQIVSQTWREAQKQTIVPESFIEISIGVGDPEAQEKAVCSDNGHERFSQTEKLTDEGRKTTVKYATLEPGIWVLDGSARLIDSIKPDAPDITSYTIVLSAFPTGYGNVNGGGEVEEGTTITVVAVPEDGYEFTAWQENRQIVSTDPEYTFTVSGGRKLVAVFDVFSEKSAIVGLAMVGRAIVGKAG